MSVTNDDFPDEALAVREYVLVLSDGSRVSMAITLGDPEADGFAARLARENDAVAYGLISVLDAPEAPEAPIVWMVNADSLSLAKAAGDGKVSAELQGLIGLYLGLFFVQTAPFAPHLANIRLQPIGVANDNHTVH